MTIYVQGLWPKDIIVSGIVTKDLEKKIGANFVLRFSFGPFQHKEYNEIDAYFKDYNTTPVTNFQIFFFCIPLLFLAFLIGLVRSWWGAINNVFDNSVAFRDLSRIMRMGREIVNHYYMLDILNPREL